MFWKSVVGKLAMTILLLVSFVLFILTILLLEFFESFHVQEAENNMLQAAEKISELVEEYDENSLMLEMVEHVKDPTSKVIVYLEDGSVLPSKTSNPYLEGVNQITPENHERLKRVISNKKVFNEALKLKKDDIEVMVVGLPIKSEMGGIFIYQTLDIIQETKAETTKIIFVAAAIAIILTTFFAFFLSTRITSPLIQMRQAAIGISKGEFDKEVPIVSRDEIGELGAAFNYMGQQLNYHMDALQQEKEQLKSIMDSMADGVITFNRKGEIIIFNPPAERFLQNYYFDKDMEYDHEHLQLPADMMMILDRIIREENEIVYEMDVQGRNFVMIMSPLYDGDMIRGAVAVIRDMTDERQLDKLRKDFIANVSHELRTPIALMQGYSEAIVDDIAGTKEEINELASIILDESLRMGRLVNELLDIGRMEAGHIDLHYSDMDIDIFIDRIYKKFQGVATEKEIELKIEKSIDQKTMYVDIDRIEQVFTNLIDNAMNHTERGGTIELIINTTEDSIQVDVVDTGSGIAEEDLPSIFERFYKADKSRTTQKNKKRGTGLGLAITKHIINAHGGSIAVKSKQGIGTRFTFKIPNKLTFEE